MSANEKAFIEKRGRSGNKGTWISVEQAKDRTFGNEEWWTKAEIGGRTVGLKQHDLSGPQDRPIWLNESGIMYLGEWIAPGPTSGLPTPHGFGAIFTSSGQVLVGTWKDGQLHGLGKSFWLKSSPTWIENDYRYSPITQKVNGKSVHQPYSYMGEFVNSSRHDSCATVTLKDGTCRAGPWKDGEPVGDWWNEEDHPLVSTSTLTTASVEPTQEETFSDKSEDANKHTKKATNAIKPTVAKPDADVTQEEPATNGETSIQQEVSPDERLNSTAAVSKGHNQDEDPLLAAEAPTLQKASTQVTKSQPTKRASSETVAPRALSLDEELAVERSHDTDIALEGRGKDEAPLPMGSTAVAESTRPHLTRDKNGGGDETCPACTKGPGRAHSWTCSRSRFFHSIEKRGFDDLNGRFIDLKEASRRTVGNEEWWKKEGIGGRSVELKQHDPTGPADHPIWLDEAGDMYLGEWNAEGAGGHPVEHGFGIRYKHGPKGYQGLCYIGNWSNGEPNGQGIEFWLDSSNAWRYNRVPFSRLRQNVNGKLAYRPFTYKGELVNGQYHDPCAVVTLKDGTCRVGPWKDDKPQGDWWNEKDHPLAATSTLPRNAVKRDIAGAQSTVYARRRTAAATVPREISPDRKVAKRESNGADAASAGTSEEDSRASRSRSLGTSGHSASERPSKRARRSTSSASNRNKNDLIVQETQAPPVPDTAVSSSHLLSSVEMDRIKDIAKWLTEAIGCNPVPGVMENYAMKLYDFGFHSIEIIHQEFTPELLESFDWIKPLHKMIIQRNLRN